MDANQSCLKKTILDELLNGASISALSIKYGMPHYRFDQILWQSGYSYNELVEVNRYCDWIEAVVKSLAFAISNGNLPGPHQMKILYKKSHSGKILEILNQEILTNDNKQQSAYYVILDFNSILRITGKIALSMGRVPGNFDTARYSDRIYQTWRKYLAALQIAMPFINELFLNDQAVRENTVLELKENTTNMIRRIYERTGEIPAPSLLKHHKIFDLCVFLFGGYSKALMEAGIINEDQIHQVIRMDHEKEISNAKQERIQKRKQQLKQKIKALEMKLGRMPVKKELLKDNLYMKCYRLYGGYKNFLKENGLPGHEEQRKNKMEKLKPFLLQEYKALAERLGHSPGKKELNKYSAFGYNVYIKNSLPPRKAARMLYLPRPDNFKMTKDEMLQHLRDLFHKHRAPVTAKMVDEAGLISHQGYVRRFGNITKALALAEVPGFYSSKQNKPKGTPLVLV